MTTLSPPGLRVVAFGDLEQEVWGVALCASDSIVIATDLNKEAAAIVTTFEGTDGGGDWSLAAEGIELRVSPESDAVHVSKSSAFDQLCRVRGDAVVGGTDQTIDCLGRRAVRAAPPAGELDSIRDFSAWFAPDDGVAVTALRPADADGHEHDAISAVLFEPAGAAAVADPRLSTTYRPDGAPARVSLELWLEQDDEGESYPRRVAGASLGPASSGVVGELRIQASAFRCFGHGLEGLGVYVLARAA